MNIVAFPDWGAKFHTSYIWQGHHPRLLVMAVVLIGVASLKLLAPTQDHQSHPGLRQVSR